MAGGQFSSYNKVLPGIYINYKSKPNLSATTGDRGTVAIARKMSWGPEGKIQEITDMNNLKPYLGYDITADEMLFIREMTRGSSLTAGASKLLICRLPEQSAAKASLKIGEMTVNAKYSGSRGNGISIIVSPILDSKYTKLEDSGQEHYYQWKVEVLVDNSKVEEFIRGTWTGGDTDKEALIEDFKDIESNWITISGTGNLTNSVATFLTGGTDGEVATSGHNDFLKELGKLTFNVVIYDGNDTVTKGAYKSFVTRMCVEEGKYCVAVMANYAADSEYCINVANSFTNEEGVALTVEQATWWVGGASSGANYNESLTYHKIPGATDVTPEYENTDLEKLLSKGNFLFFKLDGDILVLSDVNSFTSFTLDKNRSLSKNRVVRTLMQICNDLWLQYSKQYIGKVDVNDSGMKLVKGYGINYLNTIQANGGIQNFIPDDFVVKQLDVDALTIGLAVQPVDSLEKIYMEITIG